MHLKSALCWAIFLLVLLSHIVALFGNEGSPKLIKCKNSDSELDDTLEIPKHLMVTGKRHKFILSNNSGMMNCKEEERINVTLVTITNTTLEGQRMRTFAKTGILMVHTDDNFVHHRSTQDYCIQRARDGENIEIAMCPMKCKNVRQLSGSNISDARPCIHKCCTFPQQILYMEKGKVTCRLPKNFNKYQNFTLKPFLLEEVSKKISKSGPIVHPNYFTDKSFAHCKSPGVSVLKVAKHLYSGSYHPELRTGIFHLLENGNIEVCSGENKLVVLSTNNTCVDALQNFGAEQENSENLITLAILQCKVETGSSSTISGKSSDSSDNGIVEGMELVLYFVSLPIACIFLLAIIIVYILLWNTQNIHGKTVFCYILSLFILFFSLSLTQLWQFQTLACKINAVLSHFFFISTFCWLTAINFDIFWTFRKLQISSKLKNDKQLVTYTVACLTTPSIFIILGLSLDFSFKTDTTMPTCSLEYPFQESSPRVLTPQYGMKSCYISEEARGWYDYFIGGILLSCNAVFFGLTVYKLCQHRKSANAAIKASSQEDQPIKVFGKLLAIMGAGWIFEFIGWAIRSGTSESRSTATTWIIYICDLGTLLQAVALFCIFVCKRDIFDQLWQKYGNLRWILSILTRTGWCEVPPEKRSKTGNMTITSNTLGRSTLPRDKICHESPQRIIDHSRKESIELNKLN